MEHTLRKMKGELLELLEMSCDDENNGYLSGQSKAFGDKHRAYGLLLSACNLKSRKDMPESLMKSKVHQICQ